MDVRMYVCTHKEYNENPDPFYRSLQVGAALNGDLGYDRDYAGENISRRNPEFCELTGLYWIRHNVTCDVVGISHYRRYFIHKGLPVDQRVCRELLRVYDMIVPPVEYVEWPSVREHYAHTHVAADLDAAVDAVARLYPGYLAAVEEVLSGRELIPCNMLVCAKPLFDEYCDWLFDILFEVDRHVDTSGRDAYQARAFGFLSERLFYAFIKGRGLRTFPMEMRSTDGGFTYPGTVLEQKRQRAFGLMLEPLTGAYRAGNPVDLFDFAGAACGDSDRIRVFCPVFRGMDTPDEEAMARVSKLKMAFESAGTAFEAAGAAFEPAGTASEVDGPPAESFGAIEPACVSFETVDAESISGLIHVPGFFREWMSGGESPEALNETAALLLLYAFGGVAVGPDWLPMRSLTADEVRAMAVPAGDPRIRYLMNACVFLRMKGEAKGEELLGRVLKSQGYVSDDAPVPGLVGFSGFGAFADEFLESPYRAADFERFAAEFPLVKAGVGAKDARGTGLADASSAGYAAATARGEPTVYGVHVLGKAGGGDFDRRLSVVAIVRNEAPFLKEWIDFHLMVGADHIYIYDNESTDDIMAVLSPYIEGGAVTCIPFPGEGVQFDAYNDALERFGAGSRYMAFIDVDEFLAPVDPAEKLPDVIDDIVFRYGVNPHRTGLRPGGIGVNWLMYGTAFHETRPEGGVLENYCYRAPETYNESFHLKTICIPGCVEGFRDNSHAPVYKDGYSGITERGSLLYSSPFFNDAHFDRLKIAHYYTKSAEEFRAKMRRGWPDQPHVDYDDEYIDNELSKREICNMIFDDSMKVFLRKGTED
ncbi:MAG: DUF4422 domain-containing protein [Eubacterium sp.]|nr:DUF4422 domain-containing protein [Eubacterium sp.]